MIGDPTYDSRAFFASIDTVLVGRRSYEVRTTRASLCRGEGRHGACAM